MDTNAAQFARAGNPWLTPKEQAEERARLVPTRKVSKVGKFPKSAPIENRGNSDRSEVAAFQSLQRRQAFLKAFKSGLPGGTMTVAPLPTVHEPKPGVRFVAPSATPLSDAERREHAAQRAAVAASEARARLIEQSQRAARLWAAKAEAFDNLAEVMAQALGD